MPYLRLLSPRVWLLWAAVLALTLSLVPQTPPLPVHAQDTGAGSLDTTFGGDGKVTSGASFAQSKINALAVQSDDNKIVAAGSSITGSDLDFTLVRYTADGTLDSTFGENGDGKVTTHFGHKDDTIYAVEVLSGGKILVAGHADNSADNFDFALARYNADGSLDTDFGTNGLVTTAIGSGHDEIRAMALQSDGKILVAGSSHNGTNRDFALARYTANGTLDTTFGGDANNDNTPDGYIVTAIGSENDSATSVAVHTDGKIVVGGHTQVTGNNRDFAIARYTSVGALDTGFGTSGKVTTDFSSGISDDRIHGVAVLSDGKVLAGGYSSHASPRFTDFTLARYTSAGAVDTTFGTGTGQPKSGHVFSMRSRSDTGFAMLRQSDGTVLIGGYVYTGTGDDFDFAVGRFTAAGVLDTTFGTSGVVTTPIGTGNDEASALALQSGGKIVLGGFGHNGTHEDFALTRYSAAGVLDTTFGSSGIVTTAAGSGTNQGFGVALQSDDKIVMVGEVSSGAVVDFGLTRYNSDGTVDISFGKDGKVTTDFNSGARDYGAAVAIQSDGKIVATGRSTKGSATDFAVARYKTDGSLDTTFDTDGKVTTDFSSGEDRPYAIAVQSDGKIVVVGYTRATGNSNYKFAIARYDTDGSLDSTFGTGGKVVTELSSGRDRARAVVVLDDGEILVAGEKNQDFVVVRYTSAGALDTTFGGGDGYVDTAMSTGDDTALSVAVQGDGKIVAGGAAIVSGDYDFALARYTGDGSLDTSFGTVSGSARTGWVTTAMSNNRDISYGLLLQNGGRIVIAGWAGSRASGGNEPRDFALARYTDKGDLDTDFGTDGKVTTSFGPGDDRAYGAVLQDDGRIVAAGYAYSGSAYDFALARYLAPTANTVSLSVSPSLMGQGLVDEGETVTVTARLSTALEEDVTIPLTVTDGSAESNDYRAPRSITIRMGETTGTADITTSQDADTQDETFTVALGDPPSPLQKGSPEEVEVTIVDDDYPTAVTLTASTTRPSEGTTVTVRARLNMGAPTDGLTATFQITGGTAGEVDDYTLESGSEPIGEDETDAETTLTIVQETEKEGSETIELIVVVPVRSRGLSLTDQITLTIPANDGGVDRRTPPTTPPTPTPRPTVGGVGGGGGGGGGSRPRPTPTPVNTPPEFEEGAIVTVSVRENSPAGTKVGGPITATDRDGDDVRYELGGRDADLFVIDEDTGQITVAEGATLDYETDKLHAVTVIAEDIDGSGEQATIAVNINVTNDDRLPGKTDNYDADGNGALDLSEVLTAIKDYFDENLTLDEVIAIIKAYFDSGS